MRDPDLQILLVDDDEDDYVLTSSHLSRVPGTSFALEWAPTFEAALEAVGSQTYDVVLIDYRLGDRTGIDLLREITPYCAAPCILLTGQGDRDTDLEAMKAGAVDFLAKSELTPYLLERAIRYALERKRAEARLNQLALYDPLTGLANRTLFRDRLALELDRCKRDDSGVALLFLDLDHFKRVNDTLGHDAGDTLLVRVAGRLTGCARKVDTVARLGGDEFVFILAGIKTQESATLIAERVLGALEAPFDIDGSKVHIGASIGITMFPDDSADVEPLLRNADIAMYSAKDDGRNTFRFYRAEMSLRAARRLSMEGRLRYALDRDEFRLAYQPQIDIETGRVVGLEALLRWRYDAETLVSPAEFIPILEETDLINRVGLWVLETSCLTYRRWQDEGIAPEAISVNVSPTQLRGRDFGRDVEVVLSATDMRPECLELELTETALISESLGAGPLLDRLQKMGVRIALDDFGTGYACLSCLRDFSIDTLKIDRAFVGGLPENRADAAIAKAVIEMGHAMSLRVVAEGVETEAQLEYLDSINCDFAQGYMFAKPLDEKAIEDYLRQRRVLPATAEAAD